MTSLPYAEPPERFARSKPLSLTSGLLDATRTDQELACPQNNGGHWSEHGCLVANVFTTWLPSVAHQRTSSKGFRPILIWLHGGGYIAGTGLDETFWGGNIASRNDVVVITANFRLGALGWLALDDAFVPGNFGLSDVISLLHWVQRYAKSFGGDPSRVTVAGQSSGAGLVQLLLRSQAAEGLFHRAIVQSGRPYDKANNRLAITDAAAEKGNKVAKNVGCDVNKYANSSLLQCLRAAPIDSFLDGKNIIRTPVVDGDLVHDAQLDLRGRSESTRYVNRSIRVMQGYMRDEEASLGTVSNTTTDVTLDAALKASGVDDGNRTLIEKNPRIFAADGQRSSQDLQRLGMQIATDISRIGLCGQDAGLHAIAQNDVFAKTYAYTFDSKSYQIPWDPNNVCSGSNDTTGTGYHCHSGDLFPVFGTLGAFDMPYRPGDLAWFRSITDRWMSFVRTGNPNPDGAFLKAKGYSFPAGDRWLPLTPTRQQVLALGPTQRMKTIGQREGKCSALGRPLSYILAENAPPKTAVPSEPGEREGPLTEPGPKCSRQEC